MLVKEKSSNTITQLNNTQRIYLENGNPKVKHSVLCNDCKNGGLRNADMFSKITSPQYSWVNRLCDPNFYCWKVKTPFHIKSYLGQNFLFHFKLSIKQKWF